MLVRVLHLSTILLPNEHYFSQSAHTHIFMNSPSHIAPLRINNAGTNAYKFGPLTGSQDDDLEEIVMTNMLGPMLCCREVCAHRREV